MFFDIGWPELLLIGVVALVVIGPKDLPNALRIAGFWFRKARSLSREFQGSVEQMIREAELDEMRQQLKKATEFDIEKEFQKTVDPKGELAEAIRPPDIPDYFDEAPKPAAVTASTSESMQEALPVPAEMIGFEPVSADESPPQSATEPRAIEPSASVPEPMRETALPKP